MEASPCSTAAVFPTSAAAQVQYAFTNGQSAPLWYFVMLGMYGQNVGAPNATTGVRAETRAPRAESATP